MNGLGRCCVCVYIYIYTHTYTVEYYSVIKWNETGSFAVMWMHIGSVIQSEVRKRKTNTVC